MEYEYDPADILEGDDDSEGLDQCSDCGHTWPVSELEDGACPDCLLERHHATSRRREEYWRIIDGQYEISDADPGL